MRSIQKNKGVSEVVSYVLLIVIAISLSLLVYAFLKLYIPKDKLQCPPDVSLTIQDYSCVSSSSHLTINFVNRGLFNVSAAYVRLGAVDSKVKLLLRNNVYFVHPILPGSNLTELYVIPAGTSGTKEIEIEPAFGDKGALALCEKATITQRIVCN